MPVVLPFKAILPEKFAVQQIVSRAVETYTREQVAEIIQTNPKSFLNVIRPKGKNESKRMVRKRFFDFLNRGYFVSSDKASYLVYRQTDGAKTYDGIIGLASVTDYEHGQIKRHEQTLTERENLLAEYLDEVNLNAEPVCFTHPRSSDLDRLIRQICSKKPYLDFQENDQIRHQVWMADSAEELKSIQLAFEALPALYIADGHHRSASSVRLAQRRRSSSMFTDKMNPWEFFLGIFFSEDQLQIFEFNRLVKDIDGFNLSQLLEKLKQYFVVIPHQENSFEPMWPHEFGMYAEGQWFELNLKDQERLKPNPVDRLDPQIFNAFILEPCFGIQDLKTDKRIRFMSGKAGIEALKQQVDSGKFQAAFTLFPVSVAELFTIADQGLTMPPKSTWVEPKLLSGLSVYDLGQE